MSRTKIVIVGGGSRIWAPALVRDMMLTESLSESEFVLYDINKRESDLTGAFCEKLARQLGIQARIVSTDNRARAFKGADYFVITIAEGGLDSMAHDLAIPEEYGIYYTVGDTTGPAAWARLIRHFDSFVSFARDINRYAPNAMVLNYTNCMSMLTDVLSRVCDGPVVGLCHGPFENLEFVKKLYGLDSEDEIAIRYAGLNHFFWATEIRAGKIDVIADLSRRVKTTSFDEIMPERIEDPLAFWSYHELATELFRATGVLPYLGDRHTCEYFPRMLTSRRNMKTYRLRRTTIAVRRKVFAELGRKLRRMIKGKIDEEFTRRTRETAADIIAAHYESREFIDVGNLPNVGQVSNLLAGVVVETAMRVDRNGFSPIAFGPLPEPIRRIIEPFARSYLQTVDACFQKDKALAFETLRGDPLCSHLAPGQVNEMGDRLLAAHKRHITVF